MASIAQAFSTWFQIHWPLRKKKALYKQLMASRFVALWGGNFSPWQPLFWSPTCSIFLPFAFVDYQILKILSVEEVNWLLNYTKYTNHWVHLLHCCGKLMPNFQIYSARFLSYSFLAIIITNITMLLDWI